LGGDSLLRTVENRLRRLVQGMQVGVMGNIKRLNQLGIEFNRMGTLDFDEEKFNATLSKNPTGVQQFFAGDGFNVGFIPSLKRELGTILNQAFGPINIRKKALQDKISRIDDRIEAKERHVARREKTLRRQFARLEETMSRLKQQGAALGSVASAGVPQFNLSGGKNG